MITKQTDTQFREVTINEVNPCEGGWSITNSDGWSFYVPDNGVTPKVGDTARFYGDGIGRPVRGLDIGGQEVFYRTPEQQEERFRQEHAEQERKEREKFEQDKPRLDAAYNALPAVFKQRLGRFRANNPDFRWKHERYEMFCCQEALKIAAACPTEAELKFFSKQDTDQQKRVVPALDYSNHSGNTFGAATRLAWLCVTRPELVPQEHGALCPLLGCRDYGCVEINLGYVVSPR